MNYPELRYIAKDGDIVFLTVDRANFMSKLTSWFTKSRYTHVAFLFWYKTRLMIIESTTHGGIRIVFASTYADREFELIPAYKPWDEIEEIALMRSGTADYGWMSAAYIGLRQYLFVNFDIALPPHSTNRNKACSEFIAEVLDFDDSDISPGALHDRLSAKSDNY